MSRSFAKDQAAPAGPKRCTICAGGLVRAFEKDGFWIMRCMACGHRCTDLTPSSHHVDRVYNDSYFQGGGAGYPDYLAEGRLLRARGRRYARLLRRFAPPGEVLDVGAAAGFILRGFCERGWRGAGVEPNASMADHARTVLGLDIQTCSFENHQSQRHYDLVTMIQVIAHFIDPRRVIEIAAGLTRPGGFLLIETWDRASWTARAFGKHWHEYSPPSVLHWFSRRGLVRLADHGGYRPVAHGRPAKWISGKHAKSLLRYTLGPSRLGRLVARLAGAVPDGLRIPYPAEDLFWMLFRRN